LDAIFRFQRFHSINAAAPAATAATAVTAVTEATAAAAAAPFVSQYVTLVHYVGTFHIIITLKRKKGNCINQE
jgi:hypothetical protein